MAVGVLKSLVPHASNCILFYIKTEDIPKTTGRVATLKKVIMISHKTKLPPNGLVVPQHYNYMFVTMLIRSQKYKNTRGTCVKYINDEV